MSNKDRREFEIRSLEPEENSNEMILEGYAVVFNSPATHGFTEIIDPHAFDNCDMSDCVLRYNHNDSMFSLARTRNHSLELSVDSTGLKIRAKIIDTTQGRDLYKMVKEGLLDKMSFAFTVEEEDWNDLTNTRTIRSIDKLYDVAVVDVPFYESTNVYARSLEEYKEEARKQQEFELEKKKLEILLSL